VFDEILGGVSDENYDQVKLLYDKISADYSFILQITHLKQIADWHTKNIIVKKTNHVSRIETE
jgi:DNA repair ATPase RecN